MPKIPGTGKQQQTLSGSRVSAPQVDTRPLQGASQVFGEAAGELGDVVRDAAKRRFEHEDLNFKNQFGNEVNRQLGEAAIQETTRLGGDAKGGSERYSESSKLIRDKALKNIPNQHAHLREELTFDAQQKSSQLELSVLRHEGSQQIVATKNIIDNRVAQAANEASLDPSRTPEIIIDLEEGIEEFGSVLPPEAIEASVLSATEIVTTSGVTSRIDSAQSDEELDAIIDNLQTDELKELVTEKTRKTLISNANTKKKALKQQIKDAKTVADREKKEAELQVYKTNYDAIISAETFEELPDLTKVPLPPTGNDTVNIENLRKIQDRWVKGELDLFKVEKFKDVEQEIYDIKTRGNWSEPLIDEQVANETISSTQGEKLKSVLNNFNNNTNFKVNSPLQNVIQELGRFDGNGLLVVGGGDPKTFTPEQSLESAENYNDISQALNNLSSEDATAQELFNELKVRTDAIKNEKAKNILNTFISDISEGFGIIGQRISGIGETPEELEVRQKEAGRQKALTIKQEQEASIAVEFDPEGSEYDFQTVKRLGIEPDETGHLPSRDATTGLILKGRKHPTFDKTVEAEQRLGFKIIKVGDRFYSFKPDEEGVKLFLKALNLPETEKNIKLAVKRLK